MKDATSSKSFENWMSEALTKGIQSSKSESLEDSESMEWEALNAQEEPEAQNKEEETPEIREKKIMDAKVKVFQAIFENNPESLKGALKEAKAIVPRSKMTFEKEPLIRLAERSGAKQCMKVLVRENPYLELKSVTWNALPRWDSNFATLEEYRSWFGESEVLTPEEDKIWANCFLEGLGADWRGSLPLSRWLECEREVHRLREVDPRLVRNAKGVLKSIFKESVKLEYNYYKVSWNGCDFKEWLEWLKEGRSESYATQKEWETLVQNWGWSAILKDNVEDLMEWMRGAIELRKMKDWNVELGGSIQEANAVIRYARGDERFDFQLLRQIQDHLLKKKQDEGLNPLWIAMVLGKNKCVQILELHEEWRRESKVLIPNLAKEIELPKSLKDDWKVPEKSEWIVWILKHLKVNPKVLKEMEAKGYWTSQEGRLIPWFEWQYEDSYKISKTSVLNWIKKAPDYTFETHRDAFERWRLLRPYQSSHYEKVKSEVEKEWLKRSIKSAPKSKVKKTMDLTPKARRL